MRYALAIALLLPFTGWSLGFLLLYGAQATGCSLGWQDMAIGPISSLRALLILLFAATTIIIATTVFVALSAEKISSSMSGTMLSVTRYTAGAALFSTAYVFSGILWLDLC